MAKIPIRLMMSLYNAIFWNFFNVIIYELDQASFSREYKEALAPISKGGALRHIL